MNACRFGVAISWSAMRKARPSRLIGIVVAVGLLAAACGGETPSDAAAPDLRAGGPASLADLVGPWQRVPFSLDSAIVAAADRACRSDIAFPGNVQLVAIDARGEGRLITAYAGAGASAECAYTRIDPTGVVTGSLSSTGQGLAMPPGPGQLSPNGSGAWSGDEDGAVQYVIGRVGAGAERVVVDIEGLGPVEASLNNGWYIAWWAVGEDPANGQRLGRLRTKPFAITAYGPLGAVTDRYAEP
jgi:hypothetical protein